MISRAHSFLGHSRRSLWLALLVLACATPCATTAEELGRLFFTPERRQQLDHQRQFNLEAHREVPDDPTLTINGVVTRSSGKRTVWVNGTPRNENEETVGIRIIPARRNPGKVVVLSGESPDSGVGVGGTLNQETGVASDVLNGGAISVRRTK